MNSAPKERGVLPLCGLPWLRFRRKKVQPQEPIPLEKHVGDGQTVSDAVKALEHQLAEEKAKSARLQAEAAEEKRKSEGEVRQLKELLEAREKDVAQKDAKIQQLVKDGDTMRAKLAELRTAKADAEESRKRLAETEKLLSDRTTELSAAQVFLTKVDDVSEAEVVGMIDNLNTLISSASGALSDTWDQRDPIPGTLIDESDMEQIRNDFGNLIAEQIAERNSVAVNLAVQMHLGLFIERVTSGWGGGSAAGNIAKIYGMISTKESQTVASRWRTLTKRYTPQELPQKGEIIAGLARILLVTESFSDLQEAVESVQESAGAEINAIIEATLQLDDTIKTKMASSDMSVYVVLPGTPFSEGSMEDDFGEDASKGGRPVAGTMEVGLFQKSGDMEKVLRKPRVIVELDLVEPEDRKNE